MSRILWKSKCNFIEFLWYIPLFGGTRRLSSFFLRACTGHILRMSSLNSSSNLSISSTEIVFIVKINYEDFSMSQKLCKVPFNPKNIHFYSMVLLIWIKKCMQNIHPLSLRKKSFYSMNYVFRVLRTMENLVKHFTNWTIEIIVSNILLYFCEQ